jgi:SAM-dependent methyltransferase
MNSEAWNRRYAGSELLWSATPNRFLVAEVAGLAPGRALDLACGEGRNSIWLAEQGWRVTGVDFSDVALDKARRIAERRGIEVEWVHADLVQYEPPTAEYDLVALFYLQIPAGERRLVMSRTQAALATGGTLLVVGHDLDNIEHGVGGPQDPKVLYTAADLVADVPELAVEKAERVLRPVAVDGREEEAIDALLRARRV